MDGKREHTAITIPLFGYITLLDEISQLQSRIGTLISKTNDAHDATKVKSLQSRLQDLYAQVDLLKAIDKNLLQSISDDITVKKVKLRELEKFSSEIALNFEKVRTVYDVTPDSLATFIQIYGDGIKANINIMARILNEKIFPQYSKLGIYQRLLKVARDKRYAVSWNPPEVWIKEKLPAKVKEKDLVPISSNIYIDEEWFNKFIEDINFKHVPVDDVIPVLERYDGQRLVTPTQEDLLAVVDALAKYARQVHSKGVYFNSEKSRFEYRRHT